jgi:hypothetical protein
VNDASLSGLFEILGHARAGVVPVPWAHAPHDVGVQFPSDYRRLIDHYGQISLNGEFHIFAPMSTAFQRGGPAGFEGFLNLTTDPNGFCAYISQCYAAGDLGECPYPLYPVPGGLIKWANNSSADWSGRSGDAGKG